MALLEHCSAGRAYLLKERVSSVDELARAIRTVAQGGSVIDPRVVDELVRSRSGERQPGLAALTPSESVPGWRLRTSLAASMPFLWNDGGIRTSVTSTWGSVAAHPVTTSA